MARGGARPGAGRKHGSQWKPFREYVSDEERKKFVDFILGKYKSDMRLATWFGNQLFGQAPQTIDHTTKGDKLPSPILNAIPSDDSTKEDTEA